MRKGRQKGQTKAKSAINKVSKNVIANKKETYTLSEYIKEYKLIKNQLEGVR
jgi:hypothetical protein